MPEIHIAYSQRGYCTKAGYRRLEQVLEDCRVLYNAALQERRDDAWRMNGVNVSWVDQNRSLTAIRAEGRTGRERSTGRCSGKSCAASSGRTSVFQMSNNGYKVRLSCL